MQQTATQSLAVAYGPVTRILQFRWHRFYETLLSQHVVLWFPMASLGAFVWELLILWGALPGERHFSGNPGNNVFAMFVEWFWCFFYDFHMFFICFHDFCHLSRLQAKAPPNSNSKTDVFLWDALGMCKFEHVYIWEMCFHSGPRPCSRIGSKNLARSMTWRA